MMLIKYAVILTLCLSSFSLCANQRLILWNAHEHAEYLEKAAVMFQEQTGIEVELRQFISSRLREELHSLARNEKLPEILYVPADFIGMYRSIRLTKIPEDWFLPQLNTKVRQLGNIGKASYGIPLFQGNHLMLFYNKSLVDEPAKSWQELREQAKHFPADIQYPIAWKFSEMFWFIPFLSAFDGWPMDGHKVTLNTPEMAAALQFYRSLYDDGIVSIYCDQECAVEQFKTAKVPYIINGDWSIRDLQKALGENLGIATLPTINGKNMQPMSSSYVLVFPKLDPKSSQFILLKQFSQFMQSNDVQQMILEVGGLIPVNGEVKTKPQMQLTENEQAVLRQMQQSRPMPNSPRMGVAWLSMSKGFNRYIGHGYTIEKTMKYMQKIADRALAGR